MSLSTYAALQTTVAEFLNRDDLTATVPAFITLAEASLNRDIRHWRMQSRSTPDLDAQYSAVPSDWMETIRFSLTGEGSKRLEPISHADLASRRAGYISGRPRFFAMTDGQFELLPTPDGTYESELVYYARLTALSDEAPSNWLLTYHPDAYLYGALVHSAPYLADDARSVVWASFYKAAVDAINTENMNADAGGSGLRIKVRGGR